MNKIWLLVMSLLLVLIPYLSPTVAQADGCDAIDRSLDKYDVSVPPLPRYCSVAEITRKVMNIALTLIGGVSLLFIVIGGFRYMTAGGNEEQTAAGKKTAIYAVIGLVVVVLAVTIVNLVVNVLLYGRTF